MMLGVDDVGRIWPSGSLELTKEGKRWLGQKREVGTGRGTEQNPMRKEGSGKLIRTIS